MKHTPAQLREMIETCRQDLARAEGEEATLNGEIEANLAKLRKILACKAGKEKQAIQSLKKKIEKDSGKVVELLEKAEALRDGGDEEE